MVQRSRSALVILQVLSRIGLLILSIIIGLFFFPDTIHDFVINTLHYQIPSGFFGFTITDWMLGWEMTTIFWTGIIFGTLGRKIDYIFILIFFFLFTFDFISADNMTLLVYSALVGATLIGNAVGFVLKLARQRFFKDSWISR